MQQRRVVVCDDSPTVRAAIGLALADHPRITVVGDASDGEACLASVRKYAPDVVLMDVEMPVLDGVESTRRLHEQFPGVRVVALTADDAAQTVVAMIDAGASSYVLKGASLPDLERAILEGRGEAFLDQRLVSGVLEEVVRLFHDQRRATRELEALTRGVVSALAGAVEARDGYTAGHVDRVCRLATQLTRQADRMLADDPQTGCGFLLHDLGKLGVPDAILRKPGPLDDEEFVTMRAHVEIGAGLLEPIPGFERAREIVLCHHERWDGCGYPRGLRREEIPLAARLFAVCDAFDAMTSDRPYRAALPVERSLAELSASSGTQFEPEAVDLFVELQSQGLFEGTAAAAPA